MNPYLSGSEGSNPSLSVPQSADCSSQRGAVGAALGLTLLILLPSCSTRTLTIESTPPGARVILDRKEVGRTPVTVPFRYGGIHEVLLIPEPAGRTGDPYKPALVYHDSWRFGLDAPMVDGVADLLGTADAQTIRVTLERNDVSTLYRDERTRQQLLESLRQRAGLLRTRAREQFIEAAPRDPLPPTPDRSPVK